VHTPGRSSLPLPLSAVALTYVLGVAALTTVGFTIASTSLLLLAAVVTLPSSAIAVPAFYVAVGVLGLIPGANPSHSTGSGSCTPSADCQISTTGDAASWFVLATDALGILAVAAAASLNVVLLRALITARRTKSQAATRPPA
jgi:hypothetical protein